MLVQRIIILLFISLSIVSCKNNPVDTDALGDQTPEALNDGNSEIDLSSYSKRMYKDIIEQLFDEAMENDAQLKSLNKKIVDIQELKNDSLASYTEYIENNQRYWTALDQYANQLNDTLLRDDLNQIIENLESKYSNKVAVIEDMASQIELGESSLLDQQILMKILVTIPMMKNYQNNEFPDISTMANVKSTLDTLTEQVKPYANFNKSKQ